MSLGNANLPALDLALARNRDSDNEVFHTSKDHVLLCFTLHHFEHDPEP